MEAWFWFFMVRSCPDVYLQHCEALIRVMTGLFVNEQLQRHTFARLLYSKATSSLQFFKGLKFKLRIIARMSSGASMLRKSQVPCRNSDCNWSSFIDSNMPKSNQT